MMEELYIGSTPALIIGENSVQKPNAKPKNNVSSTCARPKGKRNIEDIKLEFNYGKNL